jgi:hypothetical protein
MIEWITIVPDGELPDKGVHVLLYSTDCGCSQVGMRTGRCWLIPWVKDYHPTHWASIQPPEGV